MKTYLATLFLPPSLLAVLASAPPVIGTWEKAGIVTIMAVGIGWLARRDYMRDRAEKLSRDALEKERLSIQKQLLQAHKDNAATLQGLIIADFEAKHAQAESSADLASALRELTSKINSTPCSKPHEKS